MSTARLMLSVVSFYEIGQKVRLGKWPEMEPLLGELMRADTEEGVVFLPLGAQLSMDAALLDWTHRDPFDRMIAATALAERIPLISPDVVFDEIGVERVWA